jgi:hypothetical protein
VPVDKVIISLIVTDHTRILNFNLRLLSLKKQKQFIYAAAKKPRLYHSVMAAIINKPAGVKI